MKVLLKCISRWYQFTIMVLFDDVVDEDDDDEGSCVHKFITNKICHVFGLSIQ